VIHANVTSQIVSAALDGRPLIRTLAEPFDWLWILAWSGIGATLHWGFLEIDQRRKKISTRWKVLGIYIFLTGGVLITGSYFAFLGGWWIPIISPLVALLGSAIAISGNQIMMLQQQRSELALQNFRMEQEKIKAEAASQAKGQFLAKMSHELRTPLNAILGFTQLMRRDASLSKDQREYLDIIMRSGEHLLALINDVLEMSKIEAGRITLTENSFDLYHLLDTLKEMFQLKAQSNGLKLIFERTNDVPQYVLTDEGKLRQVLINLLGNAIKFTKKGSVTLTVERNQKLDAHELGTQKENEKLSSPNHNFKLGTLNYSSQQSNVNSSPLTPDSRLLTPIFNTEKSLLNSQLFLCFCVRDTGPGIAPEEIDVLFEAFSQTSTGKKSTEGTGLGLAISHQFVQLMGGQIAVSSNLDQGTMFKFDIPIKLGQAHGIQTDEATGRVIGLAPNQREYRILVVEDNWENRQLLLKLLLSVGFQVREAENGQEAVTLWSTWEPHLILMDMRMPVMDGYEATQQIKSHEKGQATAIIALTASAFAEQRTNILAAGCDDFVSKPLREEVLWSKIAQHLGVNYIYQKLEPPTSFQSGEKLDVLTKESLSVMSKEWGREFYMAAAACNEDELFLLIEQIPQAHATLKTTLADLVNNFRIDIITDLTQEFANEEPFNS
jgi:signal transduction histidine kinase/FixJ family two-component response regulator